MANSSRSSEHCQLREWPFCPPSQQAIGLTLKGVRANRPHPIEIQARGVYVPQTPSQNQPVTGKAGSKTESPLERELSNSAPTEPLEVSQITLSVLLDLLAGPAVVQSSDGGGTSNDLDWNDERRRRQEDQENQYVNRPFKRRR